MLAPPRWEATERFRFFGREAVETFFLAPLPCLTLGRNRLGRNRKDDRLRRAGLPGRWRGRTPVIVDEIQRIKRAVTRPRSLPTAP